MSSIPSFFCEFFSSSRKKIQIPKWEFVFPRVGKVSEPKEQQNFLLEPGFILISRFPIIFISCLHFATTEDSWDKMAYSTHADDQMIYPLVGIGIFILLCQKIRQNSAMHPSIRDQSRPGQVWDRSDSDVSDGPRKDPPFQPTTEHWLNWLPQLT